jgi:hypothetical protein
MGRSKPHRGTVVLLATEIIPGPGNIATVCDVRRVVDVEGTQIVNVRKPAPAFLWPLLDNRRQVRTYGRIELDREPNPMLADIANKQLSYRARPLNSLPRPGYTIVPSTRQPGR